MVQKMTRKTMMTSKMVINKTVRTMKSKKKKDSSNKMVMLKTTPVSLRISKRND